MTQPELATTRALFVQPHFDDIALSCGGTVARAVARGEQPVVVTVFSGGPAEVELTPFARELHARWGAGPAPWRARGDEDERAMAVLGVRSLRLDLHEAIYRGYDTWPGILGGPLRDHDRQVVAAIARELGRSVAATSGARVYLPLGVGGHVDHHACYLAGLELARAGAAVVFYEDMPYATRSGRLERRLGQIGGAVAVEVVDVTEWIDQRLRAIACYASQLSSLFDEPYDAVIRRHAAWIGGGDRLGECFFRAV